MDMKFDASNKRPEYKLIRNKIETNTQVLFGILRSNAYIGLAFQMLVLYLQSPFRQQSSQIIFNVLFICSDKLILSYKKAFLQVL